jgi:3-phenylpropionate/trans-cinnamate dioxygenase ferredoxin subunit
MVKHVVCKVDDIPIGQRKAVKVRGRSIVIFHLNSGFFAMLNACPHQGARLDQGHVGQLVEASAPGEYSCSRSGEIVRCPWHGWEFDIRTGQSWCSPGTVGVRQYQASAMSGTELVAGPYKAETFPVSIDENYVVIEV